MVARGRGEKSGEKMVVTEILSREADRRREEGTADLFKKAGTGGLFLRPAGLLQHVMNGVGYMDMDGQMQCSAAQRSGGRYPSTPTFPPNPPAPDGTEPTPGDISGGAPDSLWDDQGETWGGAGGGDRYVPAVRGYVPAGAEPKQ